MKNIALIIGREYRERVYKKSFIVTTLLMPLFMVLMMVAPTLIMMFGGTSNRSIAVVDESGVVAEHLTSTDEVTFVVADCDLQTALVRSLDEETFGVLYIGKDIIENPRSVQLYTNSSSSVMLEEEISSQIAEVIEAERLKNYNIDNIKEIMAEVKAHVSISTFRNDKEDVGAQSAAASTMVGMVLGFLLYFFLAIYGSIVMQSIIEEKNSRVLEVMVSTVRPIDMMMGKILGVAAVAATQVVIWGVFLLLLTTCIVPMLMPADILEGVKSVQAGGDVAAITAQMGADVDVEMVQAMAAVFDTGYIVSILISVLLFLIGGFLLYAALYAAAGASVDEAQDASQLTLPITAPIIVAFLVLMVTMRDPDSPIVTWCSMIPFTSPIVMVARIPAGIPMWQIAISLVLLYATFVGSVWVAARIYRIGIFMHGRKPTFKDLWKWLKY